MTKARETIVSPDLTRSDKPVLVDTLSSRPVLLIPMAEWKQAAVRATRATAPAVIVLAGGGTAAAAATGAGIPPLLMVGLPTTGVAILDWALICAVIWVIWFLFNCAEFYFDVDENHPRARA